jgi:hypothetical protein
MDINIGPSGLSVAANGKLADESIDRIENKSDKNVQIHEI